MNSLLQDAQAAGARVGLKGDRITINGGIPLRGRIELKGAKNLVTKAMVAALLGEGPSVLRDVPDISDVRVVRGPARDPRRQGHRRRGRGRTAARPERRRDARTWPTSTRTPAPAASRSCSAGRCCTGWARRSSPTSAAAASATARSTTTSRCCASSARSSTSCPSGIRMTAPNGLHGAKLELPYPSVGATEQVLLTAVRAEGITELKGAAIEPEIMDLINILQKMGAIITVDTDRVIRIEGVDKLDGLQPHRAVRPQRGRELGCCGARDRRRHLRRRRPPARDAHVPQRLPQGRRRVRDPRRRHPVLPPGRRAEAGRDRDGCAPRLHDRLAAAARRRADEGERRLDRARDRLRAALRLRRRAHRDGREDPDPQGVPRRPPVPFRAAQLQPLRGHHGSDGPARRRHRGPRPARRLQPPDRGAHRRGHARPSATSASSAAGTRTSSPSCELLGADFVLEG